MKKIILALAVFVFAFSSCKKECEYWEEGKKCDTEVREKYFGTYNGVVTISGTPQNAYSAVATSSDGPKNFIIDSQIDCELTSETAFDIPLQNFYSGGNAMQVEGSGSFSGNQLIYNCILTFNGATNVMSFSGTK